MAGRIQLRRGTAANWTSEDPTLASGEVGVETDTGRAKIGNGVDTWTDLPYSDATRAVQADVDEVMSPFDIVFTSAGSAPWSIRSQTHQNNAPQADTYNNGVWMGFNAGRHGGGAVTANAPALVMGFEDNYFDGAFRGMEWYVEYFSPDNTTQRFARPFYVRVESDDNDAQGFVIMQNIGPAGAGGAWGIWSGINAQGDTALFGVSADTSEIVIGAGMSIAGANFASTTVADASDDRVRIGVQPALTANSNGCYIGWSNGVSGASAGDLVLVPRSSTNGSIRLYAGTGTPAVQASITSTGFVLSSGKSLSFGGAANSSIYSGAGSPEGAVAAAVGSIYLRTNGGASTSLYVKESGTGLTGWVAK